MTGLLAALVVVAGGLAALLLTGLGIWFQISCPGCLAEAGQTRGLPKRAWRSSSSSPDVRRHLVPALRPCRRSGELNGHRGAGHGPSGSCISAPPERRTRVTSATI
jgi:hypothetical protein